MLWFKKLDAMNDYPVSHCVPSPSVKSSSLISLNVFFQFKLKVTRRLQLFALAYAFHRKAVSTNENSKTDVEIYDVRENVYSVPHNLTTHTKSQRITDYRDSRWLRILGKN